MHCYHCQEDAHFACGTCGVATYCSEQCASADLDLHQLECDSDIFCMVEDALDDMVDDSYEEDDLHQLGEEIEDALLDHPTEIDSELKERAIAFCRAAHIGPNLYQLDLSPLELAHLVEQHIEQSPDDVDMTQHEELYDELMYHHEVGTPIPNWLHLEALSIGDKQSRARARKKRRFKRRAKRRRRKAKRIVRKAERKRKKKQRAAARAKRREQRAKRRQARKEKRAQRREERQKKRQARQERRKAKRSERKQERQKKKEARREKRQQRKQARREKQKERAQKRKDRRQQRKEKRQEKKQQLEEKRKQRKEKEKKEKKEKRSFQLPSLPQRGGRTTRGDQTAPRREVTPPREVVTPQPAAVPPQRGVTSPPAGISPSVWDSKASEFLSQVNRDNPSTTDIKRATALFEQYYRNDIDQKGTSKSRGLEDQIEDIINAVPAPPVSCAICKVPQPILACLGCEAQYCSLKCKRKDTHVGGCRK